MLAVGPHRHPVAVVVGDRRVRLHRVLVDRGKGVGALDGDRRVLSHAIDVAGGDGVLVAHVPLLLTELAKTVEEPDLGTAIVQTWRIRGEGLFERPEHGQLLVLDFDRRHRRLGGRFVHGGDRGHGLAGEPDAIEGDDRTVLDRVSVVGLDVLEVGTGQHGRHAAHFERAAGVD